MAERHPISIDVILDGRVCESETFGIWGGPFVLMIATTLPERRLAFEVHSTFIGHPGIPTAARHLVLGPVGHEPLGISSEHQHTEVDLQTNPKMCVYEHGAILVEMLSCLGYEAKIDFADDAFAALERVEH
jgi:hypothetical protein